MVFLPTGEWGEYIYIKENNKGVPGGSVLGSGPLRGRVCVGGGYLIAGSPVTSLYVLCGYLCMW